MKNKNIYQEKITRLESILNVIARGVSTNDQRQALENINNAKEILSDMQTMLNREEEYYK